MNMSLFWPSERSTYHKTCVRRVNSYLKQKCDEADYERELVTGYKTDAFGYNRKSKIWYLCEIKVDPNDLKKAPQQILDTKFHFPKTQHYHIGDTIVPVIAIPAKLANHLVKLNEWDSLRNTCKMVKAAVWVIEQSTVREVISPKIKAVKTKSPRTKTIKKKTTGTKKAMLRSGAVKTTKLKKTKTVTKRRTGTIKNTKSRKVRKKTPKK
jgi:hypothetical protein